MLNSVRLDFTQLGWLLHMVDPNLPIGGFNHSFGLETFVLCNSITDAEGLYEYLSGQLTDNWVYNDGAYIALAYAALSGNDIAEFFNLNRHFGITRLARENKEAYAKLGLRLYKIYSTQLQSPYFEQIERQKITFFYPLSFCLMGFLLKLPAATLIYAYYYNTLISQITNGVKLIPLGQMEGQNLFFRLQPHLAAAVKKSLHPDRSKLGISAVINEIRSMQHESLYSRLYMS